MKKSPNNLCIYIALAFMTLLIYAQAAGFNFTMIDDGDYVKHNHHIQSGLNPAGIRWAFSSFYSSNYHPLTWISHMLDWQLFGPNPAGHHLVNVLLHLVNVLLLFAVLFRMTHKKWQSAFVAALFAIHPLHVESVAWISERKDVLSALFWMLTMLAYARYVEQSNVKRYLLVVLMFILGLLSKPMLVSLPLILLLLDYWPLNRTGRSWTKLIIEKAPLFVLAAASCAATYWAQSAGKSAPTLATVSVGVRAANAAVSAVGYIVKMISPLNLFYFYPHPGVTLPMWQVIGATLVIALMTAVVFLRAKKQRYLLVGWLWYIITLIPVIGLVQVGMQAMADRYTYLPLIGITILITWSVTESQTIQQYLNDKKESRNRKRLCYVLIGIILLGMETLAYFQASYWQNGETLTRHALSIMEDNPFAHRDLGFVLVEAGKLPEGIAEYNRALQIDPNLANVHFNLGNALKKMGAYDAALTHYKKSLELLPGDVQAYDCIGNILLREGKLPEAARYLTECIKIDPQFPSAHNNLGCVYGQQGNFKEAAKEFSKALEIDPNNQEARNNLEKAKALINKH